MVFNCQLFQTCICTTFLVYIFYLKLILWMIIAVFFIKVIFTSLKIYFK